MIPAQDCFSPLELAAPGARLRAARFEPVARAGFCVLLGGQTEFIEKYFEVTDELRGRGFAVVTMDWRGQGGSERLLANPLKAHVRDFAEYDADLDTLMERMVPPDTRPIALAHSMGGHILLRYLSRCPDRFAAAAFSAPMVRFSTGLMPAGLVGPIAHVMAAHGRAEDFVWGMGRRDPLTLSFEEQAVTSDRGRFLRNQNFLKREPRLALGGPTWGWLDAATQSTARLGQPGFAERITTPALICGAGRDQVCVTPAARRFAGAMPQGRYMEIAGAEHEILMERDEFRAQFWSEFDRLVKNAE